MKTTIYISLLLLSIGCRFKWREKSSDSYQHLPTLSILLLDSTAIYSTKNIRPGKPIMIIYFSPDCKHCQQMTAYMLAYKDLLKNTNIIFVSYASLNDIRKYSVSFKLGQFSNIIVGSDYKYQIFNKFKITSFPDIIIYNKHQELTKLYKEGIEINRIVKALNS